MTPEEYRSQADWSQGIVAVLDAAPTLAAFIYCWERTSEETRSYPEMQAAQARAKNRFQPDPAPDATSVSGPAVEEHGVVFRDGAGNQYGPGDVRRYYMRLITPLVRLNDEQGHSLELSAQLIEVDKFWREYRAAFDCVDENATQVQLDEAENARLCWSNVACELVPELSRVLRIALTAAAPDATSVSGPSTRAELLQSARTGLAVLECEIERCCDMLAGYVDPVPVTDAESAMNTPLEALVQAACHALAAAPASVTAEVLRYEVQCRKHGTAEWFNACLADTEKEGLTLLDEVAKRWEGHASRLVSLTLHKEVRALSPIEQGLPAPASVTSSQSLPVKLDVQQLTDLINEHVGHAHWCNRVWSAWQVGTMTEDDFSLVSESDIPSELAVFILERQAASVTGSAEIIESLADWFAPDLLEKMKQGGPPALDAEESRRFINQAIAGFRSRELLEFALSKLPAASVTSPQNPWGDEPWEQYLERQREKGRSLQTTISALKSEVERNAKQIAETIAPISYHPNYDDTELDTLVQAVCHQLKQALAASVTSPQKQPVVDMVAELSDFEREAYQWAEKNCGYPDQLAALVSRLLAQNRAFDADNLRLKSELPAARDLLNRTAEREAGLRSRLSAASVTSPVEPAGSTFDNQNDTTRDIWAETYYPLLTKLGLRITPGLAGAPAGIPFEHLRLKLEAAGKWNEWCNWAGDGLTAGAAGFYPGDVELFLSGQPNTD